MTTTNFTILVLFRMQRADSMAVHCAVSSMTLARVLARCFVARALTLITTYCGCFAWCATNGARCQGTILTGKSTITLTAWCIVFEQARAMTGAMNGGITVQASRSNETTRTLTHFTFAIVQIFALTVAVASVRTCVGQAVSPGKTSVTFANSLQIWINVERACAVSPTIFWTLFESTAVTSPAIITHTARIINTSTLVFVRTALVWACLLLAVMASKTFVTYAKTTHLIALSVSSASRILAGNGWRVAGASLPSFGARALELRESC
jgi:hypothetical protein